MVKLERKTQEAIHTLIRSSCCTEMVRRYSDVLIGQRLAAQKGQSDDLVGAMNAQEAAEREDVDSDED